MVIDNCVHGFLFSFNYHLRDVEYVNKIQRTMAMNFSMSSKRSDFEYSDQPLSSQQNTTLVSNHNNPLLEHNLLMNTQEGFGFPSNQEWENQLLPEKVVVTPVDLKSEKSGVYLVKEDYGQIKKNLGGRKNLPNFTREIERDLSKTENWFNENCRIYKVEIYEYQANIDSSYHDSNFIGADQSIENDSNAFLDAQSPWIYEDAQQFSGDSQLSDNTQSFPLSSESHDCSIYS